MAASRDLNIKTELYEDLKDPVYAAAYVNEALLEGDEVPLKTALADVIKARGVKQVAERAGINRVTVYKTLRPETGTSFTVMRQLLAACDISLNVQPTQPRRRAG